MEYLGNSEQGQLFAEIVGDNRPYVVAQEASRISNMIQLVYDIPTAFLLGGFLFILMPVSAWMILKEQGTSAPTYWCVGGVAIGIGSFLLGFRGHVPDWMSYMLGNNMLFAGYLLQIHALRKDLQRPFAWTHAGMIFMVLALGYWVFWAEYQNAYWRFIWALTSNTLFLAWTAWLAAEVAISQSNKSARWLAGVYALAGLLIGIRTLRVLFGLTPTDAIATGLDSALTTISVVIIAVMGNVAVIGIYLERTYRRNIELMLEKNKLQMSAELAAQIAHLDRDRSLGELSSALAHELGQPITGILMDCRALQHESQTLSHSQPQLAAVMQSLSDHATRAGKIIQGIRRFMQPGQINAEAVNLLDTIDDVQGLLSFSIEKKHVRFDVKSQVKTPLVWANSVQLSQIFLNVFRNAIQAGRKDKSVLIAVNIQHDRDGICISIEDDGPGLSPELLEKVGRPYFTTKTEGMGIGLAISRRIAEQFGGYLNFSEGPIWGGLRVDLWLPGDQVS